MKYETNMASLGIDSSSQTMDTYITADLLKKEADKRWVQYWVILRGQYMMFYSQKCKGEREFIRGFIEISPRTKCLMTERRKYHFPFFVTTERAKYYFKCVSSVGRHEWIRSIVASSKGLPPSAGNYHQSFSNSGYDISPEIENKTTLDCLSSSDKSTDSEGMSPDNEQNNSITYTNNETVMDIDNDVDDVLPTNIIIVESTNAAKESTTMFMSPQPVRMNENCKNEVNKGLDNGIRVPYPSSRSHAIFRLQKNKRNLHNQFLGNKILSSRPSTSPESKKTPIPNVKMNVSNRTTTESFSRHFTASAPDIQTLTIDDL